MATQPHISLAAEQIGSILGLPFTNSTVMTWLTMGILTAFAYFSTKNLSLVPRGLQSMAEVILDGLYSLFKSVVGEKYIDTFFPLLATIFLYIIVSNWLGLLPGVGSIGFYESTAKDESQTSAVLDVALIKPALASQPTSITSGVETKTATSGLESGEPANTHSATATGETDTSPSHEAKFVPLFRGATADLNTTLAIAIIAVTSVQYYGIKTLGITYLKQFFNFSDPIMFGVGLLEIVSQFSRIVSFAFRLFGNIFAGEVLLTVIAFLMPLIAPLPFIGLELFVGFIQALVFSMLTAVFLNMATLSHEH